MGFHGAIPGNGGDVMRDVVSGGMQKVVVYWSVMWNVM